ncbi:MAG: hypothetical protein ACR2P1_07835 [Pseudomonadales bacterium]
MRFLKIGAVLGLSIWAVFAQGQELIVYPNQGQDAEQQGQDEYQCYGWAKGQSGFDPMAKPTTSAPPPKEEAKKGGLARGALRGAAVGALIDGSSGAKKGAGAGAVMGGARRADQNRGQAKAEEQWEQEQVAEYQRNRSSYNRAYAACLEGRGYTVR